MGIIRDVDGLITALCEEQKFVGSDGMMMIASATSHARIRAIVPKFVVNEKESLPTRAWWDGKATTDGDYTFAEPQNVTVLWFNGILDGYEAEILLDHGDRYFTDKAHLSPAHEEDGTVGPEKPKEQS